MLAGGRYTELGIVEFAVQSRLFECKVYLSEWLEDMIKVPQDNKFEKCSQLQTEVGLKLALSCLSISAIKQ